MLRYRDLFVTKTVDQIKKLQLQLNQLKSELKPDQLLGKQKAYLKRFVFAHSGSLWSLAGFAVIESVLLLSLPIIMKYLVERDYNFFQLQNLMIDLVIMGLIILIYLATAFVILRRGQNLLFGLINQIKKHWLLYFLQNSSSGSSELADGSLIAKFVYHTQLLRMGLERVIIGGGRAVIFYIVLLVAAFFFSSSTFIWLCFGLPILCLTFWGAYLIGRYYISREQTLNSRLIKGLVHQMLNLQLIQSLGLTQNRFNYLYNIIEEDTYFRKRREIWLKFGDRLVFAVILLSGALLYLVKDYFPILHWNNWSDGAVGIILTGFFTKILIEIIHAGLFWQAMHTGLMTSLPEFTVGNNPLSQKVQIDYSQKLDFHGEQVKFSKFSKSIKKFELSLEPHSKTLIRSTGPFGKSTLAKHLSGLTSIPSINAKNGQNFLLAISWGQENLDRRFLSLNQIFRESVGEFLLSTPAEQINSEDLETIFGKLKKYPEFEFIFKFNEFLGKRFDTFQSSTTEYALLQVAQTIIRQPKLICIDSSIYDLANEMVQRGLHILAQECADSTIVCFTALPGNQHSFNFSQTYLLTANEFQKH